MKPETSVQHDVVDFYRKVGCEVVVFGGQPRKTMQTPGIPDLKVYCARKAATWWFEVKTEDGKQSEAQADFQLMVESCGEVYRVGGMDEARQSLVDIGVI